MLNRLFGDHSKNLNRAMDQTALRQGVLTKNLANVNTPGYKRQDVDFGITLENEINSVSGRKRAEDDFEVQTNRGSVRTDGSSVDLESEVTHLAETELRYQMLTEMTSRYFSGLKNVIREGR